MQKNLSKSEINSLCNDIFKQLTEVLNANGANVTDNLPKRNRKDGEIKGKARNGDLINLSYEALERRVKDRLFQIHQANLQS